VERVGVRGVWSYVLLPEGDAGWILSSALGDEEAPAADKYGEYHPVWMEVPPIIAVDSASLETLETGKRTYRAQGSVLFSGEGNDRRDVYIFRNEDKVFYGNKVTFSSEEGSLIPFDTEIVLEEGVNTISIYARRDASSFAQRRILVHKR
jgi:hypothetical protein